MNIYGRQMVFFLALMDNNYYWNANVPFFVDNLLCPKTLSRFFRSKRDIGYVPWHVPTFLAKVGTAQTFMGYSLEGECSKYTIETKDFLFL